MWKRGCDRSMHGECHLGRSRARYKKATKDMDTHAMQQAAQSGVAPSKPPSADPAAQTATLLAQTQAGLKELGHSSSGYNQCLRQHQEGLRALSAKLPKMLHDFER